MSVIIEDQITGMNFEIPDEFILNHPNRIGDAFILLHARNHISDKRILREMSYENRKSTTE